MKNNSLCVLLVLLTIFSTNAQEKPTAENTGPKGNLTEYTGETNITTEGTVLENFIINGSINVRANNVTIKNCLIITDGTYGIRATYDFESLLIEDCEIRGMQSAGIIGDNFIARRCNIWDSGADALKPFNNFIIEDCYIHDLGYIETSHADGLQMVGGSNGIIRRNNFDMPHDNPTYKNSQCIIMLTNIAPIDNILLEENWINGGGFSVHVRDKNTGFGIPTNVSLINNFFGRNHEFGTHFLDEGVVFSCNRWEDTNELIGECNSLSVEDFSVASIAMYPNPASEQFTIDLHEAQKGVLNIYTVTGKKVASTNTEGQSIINFTAESFVAGMYLVVFKGEKIQLQSKMMITK
ncbi:hypothetical protein GCM10022393_08480 [Aquimarina addita]|uniref:Secretion system C-terminal sorting domain-containing protein n=1 Tax=Aquimarina addita TaxID=870485 RepID=A0ABP7XEF2_9FLAO